MFRACFANFSNVRTKLVFHLDVRIPIDIMFIFMALPTVVLNYIEPFHFLSFGRMPSFEDITNILQMYTIISHTYWKIYFPLSSRGTRKERQQRRRVLSTPLTIQAMAPAVRLGYHGDARGWVWVCVLVPLGKTGFFSVHLHWRLWRHTRAPVNARTGTTREALVHFCESENGRRIPLPLVS